MKNKAEPHQFAKRKRTNTKSHVGAKEEKKRRKDTIEEEEEEEQEDEEIEETRSSLATHRGTRDVSARGGAWARFEPRLKTDKDIGGAGGAGEVQGGGVVCGARWGATPPAADTPVAAAAVASASACETESGRRAAIAREFFCFFWWKWVYDIPTLPLPASFSSRRRLSIASSSLTNVAELGGEGFDAGEVC